LQNVATPTDALCANLSNRKFISELALEFGSNRTEDSGKARELLENLEPLRNVKRLIIRNYAGTRFTRWFDSECAVYSNLMYLDLH